MLISFVQFCGWNFSLFGPVFFLLFSVLKTKTFTLYQNIFSQIKITKYPLKHVNNYEEACRMQFPEDKRWHIIILISSISNLTNYGTILELEDKKHTTQQVLKEKHDQVPRQDTQRI